MHFFSKVEPFHKPVMKRNIKNTIRRLLNTKKMTRHRAVPNDSGKYPTIHSKQHRSYVYTDAFGCPTPAPKTDMFGNPILVPKTDEYGSPMTDRPWSTKINSIRTDRKQNSQMRRFKNRCGIQVTPSATNNKSPTAAPKTDEFGKPFMITEGLIKSSPITPGSTNTTNLDHGKKSQTKAVVITKTYLYIAVGTVTFLLTTAAVLLLIVCVMKRINQRRVENAEICET